MKDDYKIRTETLSLNVKIEKEVYETLKKMEEKTKIPADELTNTALKRFIATHKDFLPKN